MSDTQYLLNLDDMDFGYSIVENGFVSAMELTVDQYVKFHRITNYKVLKNAQELSVEYEEYLKRKYLKLAERVSEEEFYEMLECLPPLYWHTDGDGVNKFCMSEFYTGNITAQYARYEGKFIKKYVDFTDKSTYITILDFK